MSEEIEFWDGVCASNSLAETDSPIPTRTSTVPSEYNQSADTFGRVSRSSGMIYYVGMGIVITLVVATVLFSVFVW